MQPFIPDTLPIANLNWERFIPLIGPANRQIAEYNGLLQSMPNPAVLLSPLTTQEAVLSSKIEGTQVTFQDVLEYEAEPREDAKNIDDIHEVLNYRTAMHRAVKGLEELPLSLRLLKNAHFVLLSGVRGEHKSIGTFRTGQVHIGPTNRIDDARFVPPTANTIPDCMSDWEKYLQQDEKDVLVQLAILHAQFEIIHPFWDGNGRVGRMFMPLFLYSKGVLSSPMLYLSAYFEKNRTKYYDELLTVSAKRDWHDWILFFLEAITEQAKESTRQARAIHNLYKEKKEEITELTGSKYAIDVLDFLFCSPIFSSTILIERTRLNRQGTARILRRLLKNNVIECIEESRGQRPGHYVFPELLKITG